MVNRRGPNRVRRRPLPGVVAVMLPAVLAAVVLAACSSSSPKAVGPSRVGSSAATKTATGSRTAQSGTTASGSAPGSATLSPSAPTATGGGPLGSSFIVHTTPTADPSVVSRFATATCANTFNAEFGAKPGKIPDADNKVPGIGIMISTLDSAPNGDNTLPTSYWADTPSTDPKTGAAIVQHFACFDHASAGAFAPALAIMGALYLQSGGTWIGTSDGSHITAPSPYVDQFVNSSLTPKSEVIIVAGGFTFAGAMNDYNAEVSGGQGAPTYGTIAFNWQD